MQFKQLNSNNAQLRTLVYASVLILVAVCVDIAFGIFTYYNPPTTLGSRVLEEVRALAGISSNIIPIDIVELDESILSQIRDINDIQQQIYKEARPGDYVVIFDGRYIIYRREGAELIYDGPSPSQLVAENEKQLANQIRAAALARGIEVGDDLPELSAITDIALLKSQNPDFYANAADGDVVALFRDERLILVYRTSDSSIINYGKPSSVIQPL